MAEMRLVVAGAGGGVGRTPGKTERERGGEGKRGDFRGGPIIKKKKKKIALMPENCKLFKHTKLLILRTITFVGIIKVMLLKLVYFISCYTYYVNEMNRVFSERE